MKKQTLWKKLSAYKLHSRIWITVVMFLIFVLSLLAYMVPEIRANDIAANLLLALFTSLLVTVFTMITDIVVSYDSHKNEQFLEDLYAYGIESLNVDKKEELQKLLSECDSLIWISGYRLILTNALKNDFAAAINRGADLKAVVCPPWSLAFQMVYGSNEKVLDNYLKVFHVIDLARRNAKKSENQVEVFFVDKPLFSDTYRIDQKLLTGPYMHNTDPEYHRLMAKDFFSYNIVRHSKLYDIVENEYQTLLNEAKWKLDWEKFQLIYDEVENGDLRESEKSEALLKACIELPTKEHFEENV